MFNAKEYKISSCQYQVRISKVTVMWAIWHIDKMQ